MSMKDALTPDPARSDDGDQTEPSAVEGIKGALAIPVPEDSPEAAAAEQPKM